MKKAIFILLFLNCAFGFAQNDEAFVNTQVAQKIAELELQSIPEYFSRKEYCIGNIQMFVMPDGSNCSSSFTYYSTYVFWMEGELLKIQKFDNCGSFIPLTIGGEKLFKKITSTADDLKQGEVKPYETETPPTNTTANMSVQSCRKEYFFNINSQTFQKKFKEYDLTSDPANKNIHSKYNNSLALIELDKEVTELVSELEKKGKFIRQN